MSWAENIARGQPSAAAAMAASLGSPGHLRNILDGTLLGVGAAGNGAGQLNGTQDFGGR